MTISITKTVSRVDSDIIAIAFVALLGLSILFAAGFANAKSIHDSAHDTRHSLGFACH